MNILFIAGFIFITYILLAEIYIDLKQRYIDWRKYGR